MYFQLRYSNNPISNYSPPTITNQYYTTLIIVCSTHGKCMSHPINKWTGGRYFIIQKRLFGQEYYGELTLICQNLPNFPLPKFCIIRYSISFVSKELIFLSNSCCASYKPKLQWYYHTVSTVYGTWSLTIIVTHLTKLCKLYEIFFAI